jgi:tetratricopeptide (TPR) repeat protein
LNLAPKHWLSLYARANYFEMIGDLGKAISMMEQGGRHGADPDYCLDWAWLLERAGRFEEAREIFTKGVESARPRAEVDVLQHRILATMCFYRAEFLLRHGRAAEAIDDLCYALRMPRRESGIPPSLLDLTQYYNYPLVEGAFRPSDRRLVFEGLPLGCQTLAGVRFDVRGLILLSRDLFLSNCPNLAEKVSGIPVAQTCRRIHLLHAADSEAAVDTLLGSCLIHYQDGETAELPLRYGKEALAWNSPLEPGKPGPTVAWRGRSNSGLNVQLFLTTWENPRPEAVVQSIDLVPALAEAAPLVAAITIE